MQRLRFGINEFGAASGESLELCVSAPGEFADLPEFTSRTLLACRLIGYEIVQKAPHRSLAELDRAAWVSEYVLRFAGIDLPDLATCRLYAHVEMPNHLELAIEFGQRFIAFYWVREEVR
jgi:hypothetical protein